ncbi:amidohydrolase family protein [Cooperia oncophora]
MLYSEGGKTSAHIEGPFISRAKRGCHPPEFIRAFGDDPVESIREVYGDVTNAAIVTLAPELKGSEKAIRYFTDKGIVVSLGHSSAKLKDAENGVNSGARCITHLYNAMHSYHHRDPCLIGLLASKMTSPEGLILVTDAIAALGMGEGRHKLGDVVVDVVGLKAVAVGTDTTAGSVASMPHCIKHLVKAARCPLEEALICATKKPATLLGIQDRKGIIAVNADADLVLISDNVDVKATYVSGKLDPAVAEDRRGSNAAIANADNESMNDGRALVPSATRSGDVISPTRAVLTLSKSMFNAGCFSLPYAWKLGGLWVSFVLSFVIAGFNWYGNHILVRASQHLAKKSERSALDYGHFAKKVCDYSDIRFLRNNSKAVMYVVNVTILFYQLGMCSVAILFISDNMVHLLGDQVGGDRHSQMIVMASITLVFIMITNMFTEMRVVVSAFALVSSVFFIIGAAVIMQYTIRQPNQWRELPAYTNFTGTIMMIGMSMYSFEGQTMVRFFLILKSLLIPNV